MTVEDLYRPYRVTVSYRATVGKGSEHRTRSFVAEETTEDDAIWAALSQFRREGVESWDGWPTDVFLVAVETSNEPLSLKPPRFSW